MTGRRRVPLIAIVAVLVTVPVTGCSDGHPKDPHVGSVRTTAPETGFLSQQIIGRDGQMLDEGLTVTWVNEDEIAVTTWGSGSCPLLPLRLIGTDLDS